MAINTNIPNVIGGEIRKLPLNENYDWTLANDVDLQAQITANDIDIANRYTKAEVDSKDSALQTQITNNNSNLQTQITTDANNLTAHINDPIGAHGSDAITNQSGVVGANVSGALDTIQQQVNALVVGGTTNTTIGVYSLTLTGSVNAYTATFASLTYFGGLKINATVNVANTGVSTFNLNGLGVKNIKVIDANGSKQDLRGGELLTNNIVQLQYDGTDVILIQETKAETITNLNWSNTDTIKSVDVPVSGQVDVEMQGASYINLKGNGNFANGTADWSPIYSTHAIVNNDLVNTADGTQPSGIEAQNDLFNAVLNQEYFIKLRVKANASCTNIQVALQELSTFTSVSMVVSTGLTEYQEIYGIMTSPFNNLPCRLNVFHNYVDSATANGKQMFIDKNYGVQIVPIIGTIYENMTSDQINALISQYGEGLVTPTDVEVKAVGDNLFDNQNKEVGAIDSFGLPVPNANAVRTKEFINVKPNTQYYFSGAVDLSLFIFQYDSNKKLIAYTSSRNTNTSNDCKFIKLTYSAGINEYTNEQLSEGSTAKSYEPYKSSSVKFKALDKTKFANGRLPNGVYDEVNVSPNRQLGTEYYSAVKRLGGLYALKNADCLFMFTSDSLLDWVVLQLPLEAFVGENNWLINNAQFITGASRNSLDSVGKTSGYDSNSAKIMFGVTKGTNLATATGLAVANCKEILYRLTQPIYIPYEDFNQYGIELEGSLAFSIGKNTVYQNSNLVSPLTVLYPTNQASVNESFSLAIDGLTKQIGLIEDNLLINMNRQAVIDGGFQVSQTVPITGTIVTNPTSGTYPIFDMWKMFYFLDGATLPTTINYSQQNLYGVVPYVSKFLRFTTNGTGSGFGTTSIYQFALQRIENGTRQLCGGNYLTASFYARSTISGKRIGASLGQYYGTGGTPSDGEHIGGATFTLTSEWKKYTFTVKSLPIIGKTFGTNNDDSVELNFVSMWGSYYNSFFNTTSVEAFGGAGDVEITAIQLNVGDMPLQFTSENYGDVLKRCQRYLMPLDGLYSYAYYQNDYIAFGVPSFINTMRISPVLLNKSAIEGTDYSVFSSSGTLQSGFTFSLPTGSELRASKTAHGLTSGCVNILNRKLFADARY